MLKKIQMQELKPQMILGEDILGKDAMVILGRGFVLDAKTIKTLLERYSPDKEVVIFIDEREEVLEEPPSEEPPFPVSSKSGQSSEKTFSINTCPQSKNLIEIKFDGYVDNIPLENIQKMVKSVFAKKDDYQATKEAVEMLRKDVGEAFEFLVLHNEINDKKFLDISSKVVRAINSEEKIVNPGYLYLIELEKWHPDTYNHSIDVAFFSLLIATHMSADLGELSSLFLGGLLHDIGKFVYYEQGEEKFYELITKTGPLTEEEFSLLKKHVDVANFFENKFRFLTKKERENIMFGALDHHEKLDGSGYLGGKSGFQISLAGRIIAVADIYDAMIRKREYKNMVKPHIAMRHIISLAEAGKIDRNFANIFKKSLGVYPTGSVINTNLGLAIVVSQSDNPYMPRVMLIEHPDWGEINLKERIDITVYEEM